jgi:hypothetical protein
MSGGWRRGPGNRTLAVAVWLLAALPLAANEAKLNRAALTPVEGALNKTLASVMIEDPVEPLGSTRGLYLEGYGAVFTTELSIVITPGLSPFRPGFTPAFVKQFHDRKLKRLPLLRRAVADMAVTVAKTLDTMPASQQVVVVVRLMYLPWEDTAGLPSELKIQADRATLLKKAGIESAIRMEEQ